ncbi:GntR family transcriptional regulator [Xylophilus sp. GOD-11R]|uniref:GntR family transcriptional regulator n=1 Tax=Xylophilus sp. GOD-11R TaxID=3089814 RepID=UPI00298CD29B|nr:GntR family transcriptional regulator [Xylophilus sp. GOD-11R]WPB58521.1 GntR family transcriptional regulator [Xylophilus sp. GOD-11R]
MPSVPPAAEQSATDIVPDEGAAPAFSPLYQQIKTLILQRLESGDWKPGESIPSETDLALRFRVSQGTVRKAIDELAGDNLLIRRQGKGTFVATHSERHVQYRFLKLRNDSGEYEHSDRRILECKRVRASAEVARALQLRAGEPVMQTRRILLFGGVPRILEDIWLPGQTFKGLTAAQMLAYKGPTYAMFELEFGVRMVRASEKLRAVAASADQASLLDVADASPLLSVERLSFTYNDTPMELRRGLYRTDSHHYHNQLN